MSDAPATPALDLWAVHVAGPDDLRAVASREQAYRLAEWLNLGVAANPIFCGSTDTAPLIWASPARWTGTPEAHAESLASEDRDPRWSTVDDATLARCARQAFGEPMPAAFPAAEMFALGAAVCRIVENALWGRDDGGLIDGDDTSIPVSEARRLLWEEAGPCIARLLAEARTSAVGATLPPIPADAAPRVAALVQQHGWGAVDTSLAEMPAEEYVVTDVARDALRLLLAAATDVDAEDIRTEIHRILGVLEAEVGAVRIAPDPAVPVTAAELAACVECETTGANCRAHGGGTVAERVGAPRCDGCGEDDPDGPVDSAGRPWCQACAELAMEQAGAGA